jgi:hypothetical protein
MADEVNAVNELGRENFPVFSSWWN